MNAEWAKRLRRALEADGKGLIGADDLRIDIERIAAEMEAVESQRRNAGDVMDLLNVRDLCEATHEGFAEVIEAARTEIARLTRVIEGGTFGCCEEARRVQEAEIARLRALVEAEGEWEDVPCHVDGVRVLVRKR